MAELKTKKNDADVHAFLRNVEDEGRRRDSFEVLELMKDVTGQEPKMWGGGIVGFGEYTYQYASGRSGTMPVAGFSPRKQALTLYIMPGFERYQELMQKLGKYKTGKSCLYIKRLDDVDRSTLRRLVELSVKHVGEAD